MGSRISAFGLIALRKGPSPTASKRNELPCRVMSCRGPRIVDSRFGGCNRHRLRRSEAAPGREREMHPGLGPGTRRGSGRPRCRRPAKRNVAKYSECLTFISKRRLDQPVSVMRPPASKPPVGRAVFRRARRDERPSPPSHRSRPAHDSASHCFHFFVAQSTHCVGTMCPASCVRNEDAWH